MFDLSLVDILRLLPAAAVGLAAGVLSGMFGVGGGLLTTPALRLILGAPALIAVGTPLPVIVPTAITGAIAYARRGLADVSAGIALGLWGALAAIGGAILSDLAGGSIVMFSTAALILFMAVDMIRQAFGSQRLGPRPMENHPRRAFALATVGIVTGLYSGFLGLGGGFVLVPLLVRWFGYPIKRAIGTSLVAIAVLAIPGSVTHFYLGHVDLGLALSLIVGVIPGALLGAKFTAVAGDRAVKIGFAGLLIFAGVALLVSELGVFA